MTMSHEFNYIKPSSVADAIEALSESKNGCVLSGGTDLVCWLREGFVTPDVVVDIKDIEKLKEITFKDNTLTIGALVTFAEIIESEVIREKFPLLIESSKMVASTGVRNRATMVGNICSAVPSCEAGTPLLVYEASVVVNGSNGERKIHISDWFKGPKKTALNRGEFVTSIDIQYPERKHGSCYVKLGRYKGEDLAQASVAILILDKNEYRVAFGAVAPTPVRAKNIELELFGKALSDELIKKCKDLVGRDISPITDIRSTKEYREHMIKVMLERGLKAAVARLEGKEKPFGENLI
ncbi:xanthine dehydrogenase family protein subunit M [bacterium]|nr:xanthine dehydrogenase family protein subunit M [bacterium]